MINFIHYNEAMLWLSYQVSAKNAINDNASFLLNRSLSHRNFAFTITNDGLPILFNNYAHANWFHRLKWKRICYEGNSVILQSELLSINNVDVPSLLIFLYASDEMIELLKNQDFICFGSVIKNNNKADQVYIDQVIENHQTIKKEST